MSRIPRVMSFATWLALANLALAIVDNDYLNGETIRMDGALRMAPR